MKFSEYVTDKLQKTFLAYARKVFYCSGKIADFSGATRLSYLDSSDCEAIVTFGEATFLIFCFICSCRYFRYLNYSCCFFHYCYYFCYCYYCYSCCYFCYCFFHCLPFKSTSLHIYILHQNEHKYVKILRKIFFCCIMLYENRTILSKSNII